MQNNQNQESDKIQITRSQNGKRMNSWRSALKFVKNELAFEELAEMSFVTKKADTEKTCGKVCEISARYPSMI